MDHQCNIVEAGLARNGVMRHWCIVHRQPARAGVASCGGKNEMYSPADILELDVSQFQGGVALWGSVPAVYDTTSLQPEKGVHVHARAVVDGAKSIDDSFSAVRFSYKKDLLDDGVSIVTDKDAVSYYISKFLGHEPDCLFCTYCSSPHLDEGVFAAFPHRKHLCHDCGRYFHAERRGVSNPLALLRTHLEETMPHHEPELSTKRLDISQEDYPLGIQLWASNPAIIWLADRPEESGIHVHAYDQTGSRVIDDTFGFVAIDGVELDKAQVATLMAQKAIGFGDDRVLSFSCPQCDSDQFATGEAAFRPGISQLCSSCGSGYPSPSRRPAVGNPLVAQLKSLKGAAPRRVDERLYLHHRHGH